MPMMPSLGSMTSPAPLRIRLALLSATASMASRRRRTRSVRHSLANSMAARRVLSGNSLSFFSKRSSSAKASAAEPAKPASTLPLPRRRIFTASCLATTLPSVTWPSPPRATWPSRRTLRMVVDRAGRMAMRYSECKRFTTLCRCGYTDNSMAYRVPLVFGSMAGLIIAAVIVLMIVAVAIFRRPDMREGSQTLIVIGLVLLALAAGEMAYLQRDPHEIVVMVDLSPSTRTAQYRDRKFLKQRIGTLVGRNPYRIVYFSDENRTSVTAADSQRLEDLPSAWTWFRPAPRAGGV